MYIFKSKTSNKWLDKYNELCHSGKSKRDDIHKSLHHIIPRSIAPELAKDPENYTYLTVEEHMLAHYYLWKFNSQYASQAWFGTVWARKNKIWDLPGGEDEYNQLKKDVALYRRNKKLN